VSLLRMIATTEEEAGPDQRAEACLINEYVMGEIPYGQSEAGAEPALVARPRPLQLRHTQVAPQRP
jgi:hypothetical protein